jgi:CheY-like chemotaxis protein
VARVPPFASFSSAADSVSKFAWPVLAAVVLALIWPEIKRLVRSRAFTIKVGNFELSAQDANELLAKQVQDLQARLSQLESAADSNGEPLDEPPIAGAPVVVEAVRQSSFAPEALDFRRILWADDNPSGNAYEIDALTNRGWDVDVAVSTDDALQRLELRAPPAILITDLGRKELGRYDEDAGRNLILALRRQDPRIGVIVYTSSASVRRRSDELREIGASVVTDSPSELLSAVVDVSVMATEQIVREILEEAERFEFEDNDQRSPSNRWDFFGRFGDRRVAVEVVAPTTDAMKRVRDRHKRFVADDELDELWVVTRDATRVTQPVERLRLFTVESLRTYVR